MTMATMTDTVEDVGTDTDTLTQKPWIIVLYDDQDHSYYYVINMLRVLFGHTEDKAYGMAETLDNDGKAVVYSGQLETCELKRDQIHAWGADRRLAWSKGSMGASIEKVDG